jgi:hypothetical protein
MVVNSPRSQPAPHHAVLPTLSFPILRPNIDDQFARSTIRAVLQTVAPQHISVAEQLNGHQALATLW